jgi:hypothetical protein
VWRHSFIEPFDLWISFSRSQCVHCAPFGL